MTTSQEDTKKTRRSFLKLAGTAPVAAAATVVSTQGAAAQEAEGTGSGLRDTDHTRSYYETARF